MGQKWPLTTAVKSATVNSVGSFLAQARVTLEKSIYIARFTAAFILI